MRQPEKSVETEDYAETERPKGQKGPLKHKRTEIHKSKVQD